MMFLCFLAAIITVIICVRVFIGDESENNYKFDCNDIEDLRQRSGALKEIKKGNFGVSYQKPFGEKDRFNGQRYTTNYAIFDGRGYNYESIDYFINNTSSIFDNGRELGLGELLYKQYSGTTFTAIECLMMYKDITKEEALDFLEKERSAMFREKERKRRVHKTEIKIETERLKKEIDSYMEK